MAKEQTDNGKGTPHTWTALLIVAASVILAFYGSDMLTKATLFNPLAAELQEPGMVWPWGILQFAFFLLFWYCTLQAGLRSRVFCVLFLLPLLLELTFHEYLKYAYPGVRYISVIASAFSTTLEQVGTYFDIRPVAAWGLEILAVAAFVFFIYKRFWKDGSSNACRWLPVWLGVVFAGMAAVSFHGSPLPNARYILAQHKLHDEQFRSWVGEDVCGGEDLTGDPKYREMVDSTEAGDDYLPFKRFLQTGACALQFLFPEGAENPAGLESSFEPTEEGLCVVLYVGESFRADHTPFCGYPRNTLPLVTGEYGDNIIPLTGVISYATYTLEAMYGILTDATNEHRHATYGSFMSLFKKHGFHCTIADGSTDGAPWTNARRLKPMLAGSYHDIELFTENIRLREILQKRLAENKFNMLLIEDGCGHWPYDEADGSVWGVDTVAKYDETKLITDRNLDTVIRELQDKPAILLFVSDHAESLGEEGRTCHGGPLSAMEQRHVAAFIWYSDAYAELHPELVRNLKENAGRFTSQDCIFHTLPTMGGIRSAVQDEALDMAVPHQ